MRPHRPNPYTGARKRDVSETEEQKAKRPWRLSHVPQETAAERKARKRAEAIARDEDHQREGSPRSKKKRLALKKAAAERTAQKRAVA